MIHTPNAVFAQYEVVLQKREIPPALSDSLLGHSSLKTTMIYTHCVPVRTVKEPKSPLDF